MSETYRCQGCGEAVDTSETTDFRRASGNRRATYCRRCERLRDMYDLRPEDHEVYRLLDVVDDLAERDQS